MDLPAQWPFYFWSCDHHAVLLSSSEELTPFAQLCNPVDGTVVAAQFLPSVVRLSALLDEILVPVSFADGRAAANLLLSSRLLWIVDKFVREVLDAPCGTYVYVEGSDADRLKWKGLMGLTRLLVDRWTVLIHTLKEASQGDMNPNKHFYSETSMSRAKSLVLVTGKSCSDIASAIHTGLVQWRSSSSSSHLQSAPIDQNHVSTRRVVCLTVVIAFLLVLTVALGWVRHVDLVLQVIETVACMVVLGLSVYICHSYRQVCVTKQTQLAGQASLFQSWLQSSVVLRSRDLVPDEHALDDAQDNGDFVTLLGGRDTSAYSHPNILRCSLSLLTKEQVVIGFRASTANGDPPYTITFWSEGSERVTGFLSGEMVRRRTLEDVFGESTMSLAAEVKSQISDRTAEGVTVLLHSSQTVDDDALPSRLRLLCRQGASIPVSYHLFPATAGNWVLVAVPVQSTEVEAAYEIGGCLAEMLCNGAERNSVAEALRRIKPQILRAVSMWVRVDRDWLHAELSKVLKHHVAEVQLSRSFPEWCFMDPSAVMGFVRRLISKDQLPPLTCVQIVELDTMLHTQAFVLSFHTTSKFSAELIAEAQSLLSNPVISADAAGAVPCEGCGVLLVNNGQSESVLRVAFYVSRQPLNHRYPITYIPPSMPTNAQQSFVSERSYSLSVAPQPCAFLVADSSEMDAQQIKSAIMSHCSSHSVITLIDREALQLFQQQKFSGIDALIINEEHPLWSAAHDAASQEAALTFVTSYRPTAGVLRMDPPGTSLRKPGNHQRIAQIVKLILTKRALAVATADQGRPLETVKLLGEGSTAPVLLMRVTGGLQGEVAVKSLKTIGLQSMERAILEYSIMNECKHPNIVRCMGMERQPHGLNLVMEYCSQGTVHSLTKNGRLAFSDLATVLVQTLHALAYLHAHDFVHRDVKPTNLYLCPGNIVKLGDFGLAVAKSTLEDEDISRSFEGTPAYLAPERLERARDVADLWCRYVASDVWAVGITALALCNENMEVSEQHQLVHFFSSLERGCLSRPYSERVLEGLQQDESMALQEFLHNALWLDYGTRPTALQLLQTKLAQFAQPLPQSISTALTPRTTHQYVETTGRVVTISGAANGGQPSDLLTAGSYSGSSCDEAE